MSKQSKIYFLYAPVPEATQKELPQIDLPKKNYHITLKYLGAKLPVQEQELAQQLSKVLQNQKTFTTRVRGYGDFNGRVYHAQINKPKKLIDLKHKLNKVLGPDVIHREYKPHVTLSFNVPQNAPSPKVHPFEIKQVILGTTSNADRYEPYTRVQTYDLKQRHILERFTDWIRNIGR